MFFSLYGDLGDSKRHLTSMFPAPAIDPTSLEETSEVSKQVIKQVYIYILEHAVASLFDHLCFEGGVCRNYLQSMGNYL